MNKRLAAWLFTSSLVSTAAVADGTPGQFDSYLLALSWSPDHCAANPTDTAQCGKKLGFVLHGLWPQYNRNYPSFCSKERMTEDNKQRFAGLYPSNALFDHEWEKHGTCSGLGQVQYLELSKKLKDTVQIPSDYAQPAIPFRVSAKRLKKDFVKANPWLKDQGLAVNCSGSSRFLKEVWLCFDKTGSNLTTCPAEVIKNADKSCSKPDFLVRSVK